MQKDVNYVFDRCLVCIRNTTFKPYDASAKALEVGNLFDLIQIDLVGGFNTSKDGFSRVCIIIDFLSKFVRIYPLKTKTASEVSEKLWWWITEFSPPKSLLSDAGTEFLNATVTALLTNTGVERRVTSAYNPNCNGGCERANQTIVNVLVKHSESDQISWDLWIPFVQYAYNTKTHASHGFSPFMIMFGVEPNDFINFKIDPKQTEEQQLFLRSIQAKNLVEITRPEAMDNIRFKQIKQKQIQDDRNNVLVGDLPTGTLVMLKSEGLLSKLEPLHHGRHIVSGRTSEGNYILENALGQRLKDTYPL